MSDPLEEAISALLDPFDVEVRDPYGEIDGDHPTAALIARVRALIELRIAEAEARGAKKAYEDFYITAIDDVFLEIRKLKAEP